MRISSTSVDSYMYSVWRVLAVLEGCREADRRCTPLRRYVNTGRASTPFLKALLTKPPHRIAELLREPGSDDAIVDSIKEEVWS